MVTHFHPRKLARTALPDRRSFRVQEFAFRHSISRSKVYEEIRAGRLNSRRVNGVTIITDLDEDEWLSSLPQTKTPALVPDTS